MILVSAPRRAAKSKWSTGVVKSLMWSRDAFHSPPGRNGRAAGSLIITYPHARAFVPATALLRFINFARGTSLERGDAGEIMDPADPGHPADGVGVVPSGVRDRGCFFSDSTGDSPGRQKPKCGRLRGALTMQDEKGRRESCRQRTRSGVFLMIISLISRQHMLSAVRNGSHVSGGKLSAPRQSHRLQTRIAASIALRSH